MCVGEEFAMFMLCCLESAQCLRKCLLSTFETCALSTSTSTMLQFDQVLEALSSTLEKVL